MVTDEEAAAILETATDKETRAAVGLTFLIYYCIGETPDTVDIPIQQKALSIETIRDICLLIQQ